MQIIFSLESREKLASPKLNRILQIFENLVINVVASVFCIPILVTPFISVPFVSTQKKNHFVALSSYLYLVHLSYVLIKSRDFRLLPWYWTRLKRLKTKIQDREGMQMRLRCFHFSERLGANLVQLISVHYVIQL
jgi:hypothetical protein